MARFLGVEKTIPKSGAANLLMVGGSKISGINSLSGPPSGKFDRDGLLRYFTVEKLTDERDHYGVHKRKLGPLRSKPGASSFNLTLEISRLH